MQATISTDDITADAECQGEGGDSGLLGINHTERPCAAHGWTSYRYAGRYGTIMIGASSTQDALNEADRSLTQGAATVERLEIWNALTGLYEKVRE